MDKETAIKLRTELQQSQASGKADVSVFIILQGIDNYIYLRQGNDRVIREIKRRVRSNRRITQSQLYVHVYI